jgi:hypothetical protein
MIRRFIVPKIFAAVTAAAVTIHAGVAFAQGAFPAPLPNGQAAPPFASPPANDSAFTRGAAPVSGPGFGGAGPQPPSGGAGPSDACMKGFVPLREDAEKRGKLIKAASDRHAPPEEACKLIGGFGAAEVKMIKYIEANSAKCGIPPQIADQLKAGHKNTEKMQNQVCNVAQQQASQQKAAAPSLSDVLGTSAALPEAQSVKKGGSTFDTLNGNVLTR